jgi:hypothetical protein
MVGIGLCLFLAIGLLARAQQGAGSSDASLDRVRAEALIAMGLGDAEVTALDVPVEPVDSFVTVVELDGVTHALHLDLHSMRAPDFRALIQDATGDLIEVDPPAPRTYEGFVKGIDGSRVAASLTLDGELSALVELDPDHLYTVEPASSVVEGSDRSLHVVYRSDDVVHRPEFRCGVEDATPRESLEDAGEEGIAPFTTLVRTAEIAFDADYEYYLLNGSSVSQTIADMESVMNGVEVIYERDVGINYEVTYAIVRTSEPDPYSTSNPQSLLYQFQNYWNANYNSLRRDVAHLFTGKNIGASGAIGIAFLSAVCSQPDAYGLVQSRYSPLFADRVGLSAHEIGHNWSAVHCDGDADCKIMCSVAGACTGIVTSFGSRSVNDITAFRNTRPCLYSAPDPWTPPFFDSFDSTGIDVNLWSWNDGAIVLSSGLNEPSEPYAVNLDSKSTALYGGDNEIRTNKILLGGASNVTFSFFTQHRGPANGEQLIVEYQTSSGAWSPFVTLVSDGVNQDYFHFYHDTLSSAAIHDGSRFRFRTDGNASMDDWFIDNVSVASSEVLVTVLPDNTSAPPGGTIFLDAYVTNLSYDHPNPATAWVNVYRPDGSPLALGGNPKFGPKSVNLNPGQLKSKLNVPLRVPGDAVPGPGYRVIAIVGDEATGLVANVSEFQFTVQ